MSAVVIPSPALVIDRSRLESNIERMAQAMRNNVVALRPHFKTSKMIEVACLQMAAGAVGFTCATPEEVEALLDAGISDLFWAHSPVGAKADRAAMFNQRGVVTIGIDSRELAEGLADAARRHGVVIPVRVEIDTGLGRTGVTVAESVELARVVSDLEGLTFDGVYTHEGQLASVGGSRENLRDAGLSAAHQLVDAAQRIRATGIEVASVSVGSTPGWDSAPLVDGVTEARPGTYVFNDANQLRLESAGLANCALTVHATVVSTQREGAVIVDAGLKAMSGDGSNRGSTFGLPLTADRELDGHLTFVTAHEEHGRIEGDGSAQLSVGDRIEILPNHACGVVNMWSTIYVIDDAGSIDIWNPVGRH